MSIVAHRRCGRRFALTTALALLSVIAMMAGCSRAHYRRQADRDAYNLVGCSSLDPRWPLDDFSIQVPAASRMFDPWNPDKPPLPPDDASSHILLHRVAGKKGYHGWHKNGDTPYVENPCWRNCLPYDEDCFVTLDRSSAVELALLNSRDYQQELEDLYLSALDVSFERFRLETQFFATDNLTYTADGRLRPGGLGQSQSVLENDINVQAQRTLATGGQLLVEFANSMVWQFAGPDTYATTSLLDFSLVQPLLRGAGRKIALERLTQSERTLLANVRQLERYRRAFLVLILTGRATGPGPGLTALTLATLNTTPLPVAVTGAAQTGVLGLLSERQTITNQRANVAGLLESVEQLEATYEANRIDRFQVDLARQSLFNAQSQLLQLEKTHQDRLDAFKIVVGVPPDLKVRIRDSVVNRFNLMDPQMTAVQDRVNNLRQHLRSEQAPGQKRDLSPEVRELGEIRTQTLAVLEMIAKDLEVLDASLPRRRASLKQLAQRAEVRQGDVDPHVLDIGLLDTRVATLKDDYPKLLAQSQQSLAGLDELVGQSESAETVANPAAWIEKLRDLMGNLSNQLGQLSLVQAQARLDSLTLLPIEMEPERAIEIARCRRLDWMNARAALVDVWRQVEVRANDLMAGMNVSLSGDVRTTGNNPTAFTSSTGRLRVGLQFDAPLTRLAERNAYREALVEYQRSRRAYYAYEDRVYQTLRTTLRQIRLDQVNFEIRRAAVSLAIAQVEVTRLRLIRPPKPGEVTQLGATTARDLVQSLAELLSSENLLLNVWFDYETQRLNLDLDLGTMELDRRGMWVDPGPIENEAPPAGESPEELPAPEPLIKALEVR